MNEDTVVTDGMTLKEMRLLSRLVDASRAFKEVMEAINTKKQNKKFHLDKLQEAIDYFDGDEEDEVSRLHVVK